MTRLGITAGFLFLCAGVSASADAHSYRVVSSNSVVDLPQNVVRTETVVQDGDDSRNRFMVTRVVAADSSGNPVPPAQRMGAIVLIAGTYQNFDFYDDSSDATRIAPYLAARGIDVYGYSPRTQGWDGKCDANPDDCSFMRSWDFGTYLADIEFVRTQAQTANEGKLPILGGYSFGTIVGYAVLNSNPSGWAAAMLTEGLIYTQNTSIITAFQPACAQEHASGVSPVVNEGQQLKAVARLAQSSPTQTSPFASSLTNEQFLLASITTPVNPPDGAVPGYTLAAGDVSGLKFSPLAVAEAIVLKMNDYDPTAAYADWFCAVAGDKQFVSQLGQFHGPTITFSAGHGFGAYMSDNIALLGSADVESHSNPDFGHADFFGATDHVNQWEGPIGDWIVKKVSPLWQQARPRRF